MSVLSFLPQPCPMTEYFDWIVGVTTIAASELMVRKKWYAWLANLANQGIWLTYIYLNKEWGLLPLNFFLTFQAVRGLRLWLRDERGHHDKKDSLPDAAAPSPSSCTRPR